MEDQDELQEYFEYVDKNGTKEEKEEKKLFQDNLSGFLDYSELIIKRIPENKWTIGNMPGWVHSRIKVELFAINLQTAISRSFENMAKDQDIQEIVKAWDYYISLLVRSNEEMIEDPLIEDDQRKVFQYSDVLLKNLKSQLKDTVNLRKKDDMSSKEIVDHYSPLIKSEQDSRETAGMLPDQIPDQETNNLTGASDVTGQESDQTQTKNDLTPSNLNAKYHYLALMLDHEAIGDPLNEKKRITKLASERTGDVKGLKGNTIGRLFYTYGPQNFKDKLFLVDNFGENWREKVLSLSKYPDKLSKNLETKYT